MRTEFLIEPDGWECTLEDCPPGHFMFSGELGFKSEYRNADGGMEVFCSSGEIFWGGTKLKEERRKLMVQPVVMRQTERDD